MKSFLVLAIVFFSSNAFSWDPIGDLTNPGRILRNVERETRNAGQAIDRTRREIDANIGGEALKHWIIESRNDARRAGTNPIPQKIYNDLVGYFGEDALRGIRYRAHNGHFLNLANASFNLGDRDAITLDNIIVFRSEGDALNNVRLWAHEVAHVQQYRSWGIRNFSIKYIRSYNSVENSAENVEEKFSNYLASNRSPSRGNAFTRQQVRGSTVYGNYCQVNYMGNGCQRATLPVGTSCSCVDMRFNTLVYGRIVR